MHRKEYLLGRSIRCLGSQINYCRQRGSDLKKGGAPDVLVITNLIFLLFKTTAIIILAMEFLMIG